jgi:glycosyltransferase involved in cell wall biosynthesis
MVHPQDDRRRLKQSAARRLALFEQSHLFSLGNIQKFSRYCRTYGFHNATVLAFRKLCRMNIPPSPTIRPLVLPELIESPAGDLAPIDRKISVVIPTKNAGNNFRPLLRKMKLQKGLKEIEIIVVDSGSTDGTTRIAHDEGAEVLEIAPEEFTHAYSRNRGAELATGDLILFFVQDALPLSDRWLWEMTATLVNNDVAAVSCAEYPRSDCDLFYRCLMWNHYRSLHLDKDRFLSLDKSCSSHHGMRANGQLSDIAALIRKDIFIRYRFKTSFAEDLDLGIRLIKDGYRIGFLHRTRVLHSHNRPPYYYMKRAFVDARFQKKAMPDLMCPIIRYPRRLFRDIIALHHRTRQVTTQLQAEKCPGGGDLDQAMKWIKSLFTEDRTYGTVPPTPDSSVSTCPDNTDAGLESFINMLSASTGDMPIAYNHRQNMMVSPLLYHLEIMQSYISQGRETADDMLLNELRVALHQLAALHSGSHLAYMYMSLSECRNPEHVPPGLDVLLCEGV